MTFDIDPLTLPFVRHPSAVAVHHDGVDYRWLVRGQDTNGQLAVAEIELRRDRRSGGYTHSYEDLMLITLQGELAVTISADRLVATERYAMWLPRHVPHRVRALSERARALLVVIPAGWEATVEELGAAASAAATRAAYSVAGVHRLPALPEGI